MSNAASATKQSLASQILKILSGPLLCLLILILPQPEGLPAFEQRLAQTLEQALSSPAGPPEGITRLSWQGVSQRILAAAGVE